MIRKYENYVKLLFDKIKLRTESDSEICKLRRIVIQKNRKQAKRRLE